MVYGCKNKFVKIRLILLALLLDFVSNISNKIVLLEEIELQGRWSKSVPRAYELVVIIDYFYAILRYVVDVLRHSTLILVFAHY